MRLPRARRMHRRADFRRVRDEGRSYPGRYLVLGVLPDEALEDLRFGIITTRRTGKAVERVRLRRRLRGLIQREGNRIRRGHYLVTVVRHAATRAPKGALEKEWLKLARKAGLLEAAHEQTNGCAGS